MPITRSLIALGANLPFGRMLPEETLRSALQEIFSDGLEVIRISPFYRSPAFPTGSGPDYVNAAAVLEGPAAMTADHVLAILHRVEAGFGRERQVRWGGRTLDLDLIAMGDLVRPDAATHAHWRGLSAERQRTEAPAQLILPHPRLQDRAFVLVPLADIAPDWTHPVLGLTTLQMLAALPPAQRAEMVPL